MKIPIFGTKSQRQTLAFFVLVLYGPWSFFPTPKRTKTHEQSSDVSKGRLSTGYSVSTDPRTRATGNGEDRRCNRSLRLVLSVMGSAARLANEHLELPSSRFERLRPRAAIQGLIRAYLAPFDAKASLPRLAFFVGARFPIDERI